MSKGLIVAVAALALGCDDAAKTSEQKAVDELARIVPIVQEDVGQLRKGLPAGAAALGTLLDADPAANPAGVQKAIGQARAKVKDLELAKSTFFSFADATGVVIRSEADPDYLAGKSVVGPFPELKKALEPASGVVELFGEMPEMRGVKNGPDLAWVVAHPVKDAGGAVKGLFVTGWSYRRFAYHLDEMAKRHQSEEAQQKGEKSTPLLYVFALKKGKAYGAPLTPDVDAEAVEKLDLVPKTAGGPWRGRVDITGRTFGVAAQRTPELGDDAAVVVLASQI